MTDHTLRIDNNLDNTSTVVYTPNEMIEVFPAEMRDKLARGETITDPNGTSWTDLNAFFKANRNPTIPTGFIAVATYIDDADVSPMWTWGSTEEIATENLRLALIENAEEYAPVGYDPDAEWLHEYTVPMTA